MHVLMLLTIIPFRREVKYRIAILIISITYDMFNKKTAKSPGRQIVPERK